MNHAYVFAANRIFSEIPDSWFFDAIFNEIKVDNQLVIFTARVNIILHNIHKFFSTENFDWHLRLLFPVFFLSFCDFDYLFGVLDKMRCFSVTENAFLNEFLAEKGTSWIVSLQQRVRLLVF